MYTLILKKERMPKKELFALFCVIEKSCVALHMISAKPIKKKVPAMKNGLANYNLKVCLSALKKKLNLNPLFVKKNVHCYVQF